MNPLQLTPNQFNALSLITEFMEGTTPVFILTGYAGTGKTTILRIVQEQLVQSGKKVILMAPTGRAAKVLRQKTSLAATTVHSGIYNYNVLREVAVTEAEGGESFKYYFEIKENKEFTEQVFIVDEASMLSETYSEGEFFRFGSGFLLRDLIYHSNVQHVGSTNKIIFVGDPAQLPPPDGSLLSPGLSPDYLLKNFQLSSMSAQLTEVIRQEHGSAILDLSVQIRRGITSGYFNYFNLNTNKEGIKTLDYSNFLNDYKAAKGKKIAITYTNKMAHQLNLDIRRDKFGNDDWLCVGDVMMVGQNNHLTGLFNGEFGLINRIIGPMESRTVNFKVKGDESISKTLVWQKIELVYADDANQRFSKETYMLVNFLDQGPQLDAETQRALYIDFKNRYEELPPETGSFNEALRNDPYFNALRLKYGFAITCHKAQGGEWDSVLVFWDYGNQSNIDKVAEIRDNKGLSNISFFRWAYTAITRASSHLYCVNPPVFTPYSNMVFIYPETLKGLKELDGQPEVKEAFVPDHNIHESLIRLGLDQQPAFIQHHAMSVLYQCRKEGIELVNWKKNGFEVVYYFYRGQDKACLKGWIKQNETFNPSYHNNPSGTNSQDLLDTVKKICEDHQKYQAILSPQNSTVTSNTINALDAAFAEEKPFLNALLHDLQAYMQDNGINIINIEHLPFRERYTFTRNSIKTIVDFIYDGEGFFGRVEPLLTPSPAPAILEAVINIIEQLKHPNHAI